MYNTKILDLLFVFLFNFYYTLKIITWRNFEFILTNIICIEQTFKKTAFNPWFANSKVGVFGDSFQIRNQYLRHD